ncbi:MAG: DNA polymerase III subunit gamma/tau [Candidatus Zapsychrus exili]|nr:DNA polymerase III subunit gamma/tau [Candidatus Zapsychrus exili]
MSYLVLARKYRPQNFDEIIGQDHIIEILKKAVLSDKVSHAYLFSGPRGIGKTSCARILAKSLNCEKGPTTEPCHKCPACDEITKGTSFDVLEIDGASNRGIDEIRTLRENVKFAPSCGKFKIYIVDEVHMLTMEAFNALLKTLEEPPEHVKFIFATTAPNKVPQTIISRCQRFDFKRMSLKVIADALESISKKEKFRIDIEALSAIGKAAEGSFRDALSILDQLSALSDNSIKASDVFSMLGLVETQLLFNLVDKLADKNCSEALKILDEIIDKGKDVRQLVKNLNEHFRNLMIIKVGGKSLGKLVNYPVSIKEMFLKQADSFSLKDILSAIDVLIQAQETSRITESMRMPLEVAFAKLTYVDGSFPKNVENVGSENVGSDPHKESSNSFLTASALKSEKGAVDISGPLKNEDNIEQEIKEIKETSLENNSPIEEQKLPLQEDMQQNIDLNRIKRMWDSLTHAVSRERMSIATYLQEGSPSNFKENKITIAFPSKCRFQKESLENQATTELIERKISEKLNSKIFVEYIIDDECEPQILEDPSVKNVLDAFKGKITNKWHNE